MQIHELNNFTGTLGSGAYLAIDDGNDTGKISSQGLLAATEARIDNIIAGPAPSAEEIVDARLGDDGVTYPSLGDAIRDQFSDVKSDFNAFDMLVSGDDICPLATDFKNGTINGNNGVVDLSASAKYRVVNPTLLYAKHDTVMMALANYRLFVCYYQSDGTFINNSGWILPTRLYTIPHGSYYRYLIAQIDGVEDWHNTADVPTFVSNVRIVSLFSTIKSDIDAIGLFMSGESSHSFATDFRNGILKGTTGAISLSSADKYRIVTPKLHYAYQAVVLKPQTNYRAYVCYYQSDGTFINNSGWILPNNTYTIPKGSYYKMQIAQTDAVEDINKTADVIAFTNNVLIDPYLTSKTKENTYKLDGQSSLLATPLLRNGTLGNIGHQQAICTAEIQPFNQSDGVTIYIDGDKSADTEYKIVITTYSVDSGTPENNTANRITSDVYCGLTNGFFRLDRNKWRTNPKGFAYNIVKYVNGTMVSIRVADNDVSTCILHHYSDRTDTLVNSSLQSIPVHIRAWGYIPKPQAFTIYNGYVYAIGNDAITKSSLLTNPFTVIDEKSISVGHGNSLQKGSGSLAYASGWDDNTIYIVDLDTMTVIDTIALPTTGYTTCAVDDEKQLAYIFQRDSYPDTETCYNFIVYDYANDEIIRTTKTPSFGAMQACDLFEDKIIVASGLASAESPNRLRVYSSDGNVLTTYFINSVQNELEGVCLDRDTHTLYFSDISQIIYVVEL